VIDGNCVISTVPVKGGDGVGDIIGGRLGSGAGVTVFVIVKVGLRDGNISIVGVDVASHMVVADFVGVKLAVPEGNGEGLDVKVDDGSWVGKTARVGGERSNRPGETPSLSRQSPPLSRSFSGGYLSRLFPSLGAGGGPENPPAVEFP